MAFRFGDPGGRMYATANILSHWTSCVNIGGWSVLASNGRTTGSCLRLAVNVTSALTKTLDAQATWGFAFGFRISAYQSSVSLEMCGVQDGVSNQVDLRLNATGTLSVTRNGTVLGTTAVSLSLNTYYHIEFKTTISDTVGTVQLWINGASQLNLTLQDTKNTANATGNIVFIGSITNRNNAANWDYDDIIIYDGQTTDANGNTDITGPIGDCGLVWLLPTAAGANTQFTSPGGANYTAVDDATPDGDSTYVESSTVGHIDTYTLADLPATVTAVKSLAVVNYARKTDVGSRGMKAMLNSSSTNYPHAAAEIPLADSYLYYFSGWGSHPAAGASWTPTTVNSLEAGQKVNS
jgi:hypothetical protein